MNTKLKRGDVIAYVPHHAEGKITHPDVEYGIVTSSSNEDVAFCRYFRRGTHIRYLDDEIYLYELLRTKSNSEATPKNLLVKIDGYLDSEVTNRLLGYIDSMNE